MFGEISAFGGPLDDKLRAEMFDEGLTILTGLWRGEPFSIEGSIIGCIMPTWFRLVFNRPEFQSGSPVHG